MADLGMEDDMIRSKTWLDHFEDFDYWLTVWFLQVLRALRPPPWPRSG